MADKPDQPKNEPPKPRQVDARFVEHLNAKWTRPKSCPVCDTDTWIINENVAELRGFYGGATMLGGGPIFPAVAVICDNCGYTIFFNAIKAGVVEPQENRGPEEKK